MALRQSSSGNCGKLIVPSHSGAVAQLGERRLCTAEVRGSNPLGSTVENAVLQEKREPRISSPTVSQAFVQRPTYILDVGVPPRSALADLTEPCRARRGRWRRTARSPSPRSGR